jgi:hypothetical protein
MPHCRAVSGDPLTNLEHRFGRAWYDYIVLFFEGYYEHRDLSTVYYDRITLDRQASLAEGEPTAKE